MGVRGAGQIKVNRSGTRKSADFAWTAAGMVPKTVGATKKEKLLLNNRIFYASVNVDPPIRRKTACWGKQAVLQRNSQQDNPNRI
jgi:hypothetical protein